LFFTLAGKDFEADVLKVTFQPGQSHSSVCVVIIDDDIREGTENFRLVLSIPYSVQKLGVWTGYPYYADVVITGTYMVINIYIPYSRKVWLGESLL